MEVMKVNEIADLSRCEEIIERGLKAFYEVGSALLEIRDKKLYRGEFKTFEAYCRERWEMKKAHAYRLMEATQVVEILSPIGDLLPTNEAQIRPLTKLKDPEDQQKAWKRALETAPGGKVTARVVQDAVDEMLVEPTPELVKEEEPPPIVTCTDVVRRVLESSGRAVPLYEPPDRELGPIISEDRAKHYKTVDGMLDHLSEKMSELNEFLEPVCKWLDQNEDEKKYDRFMKEMVDVYTTITTTLKGEGLL